jgi:hypothetical protein
MKRARQDEMVMMKRDKNATQQFKVPAENRFSYQTFGYHSDYFYRD